jgi:hypothetical protein
VVDGPELRAAGALPHPRYASVSVAHAATLGTDEQRERGSRPLLSDGRRSLGRLARIGRAPALGPSGAVVHRGARPVAGRGRSGVREGRSRRTAPAGLRGCGAMGAAVHAQAARGLPCQPPPGRFPSWRLGGIAHAARPVRLGLVRSRLGRVAGALHLPALRLSPALIPTRSWLVGRADGRDELPRRMSPHRRRRRTADARNAYTDVKRHERLRGGSTGRTQHP